MNKKGEKEEFWGQIKRQETLVFDTVTYNSKDIGYAIKSFIGRQAAGRAVEQGGASALHVR